MNPWLRELVRTLATIAIEDARVREARGQDSFRVSGEEPLTPISSHGNVETGGNGNPSKTTRIGREADQ